MRTTWALARVLSYMEARGGTVYGLEVIRATGLKGGAVYPILRRIERDGWVTSEWEKLDAREEGRPRRLYWSLTLEGRQELSRIMSELVFEE